MLFLFLFRKTCTAVVACLGDWARPRVIINLALPTGLSSITTLCIILLVQLRVKSHKRPTFCWIGGNAVIDSHVNHVV